MLQPYMSAKKIISLLQGFIINKTNALNIHMLKCAEVYIVVILNAKGSFRFRLHDLNWNKKYAR